MIHRMRDESAKSGRPASESVRIRNENLRRAVAAGFTTTGELAELMGWNPSVTADRMCYACKTGYVRRLAKTPHGIIWAPVNHFVDATKMVGT